MARKEADPRQEFFFGESPQYTDDPTFKPLEYPVWSRNKAKLVQRYLQLFVFITKHGTYIDGFAGPQEPDKPETWTADRVFNTEPRWLRNFFLCELDRKKIPGLRALEVQAALLTKAPRRVVKVLEGDFNERVDEILASDVITEKEAVFCLLDQRTFECNWETVVKIAQRKRSNKIELFYFLGTSWLHRAFSGLKIEPDEAMTRWWGREDWHLLKNASRQSITDAVVNRFKEELGYRYAHAFPIFGEEGDVRIMYQMIHASDHREAPSLMVRAYRQAVDSVEPPNQFQIDLAGGGPTP